MTIIEKGPSKVLTPVTRKQPLSELTKNEQARKDITKPSSEVTLEKSGKRDTDLLSTATSALRRLHFRSAGGSRPKRGQQTGAGGQSVPKLMLMGSSTASDTTTNTSTDSSNTVYTMVTVTDAEQEEKTESHEDGPKSHKRDEKFLLKCGEKEPGTKETPRRKLEGKTKDILNEFDELFLENEKRINADRKTKGKGFRNGMTLHRGTREESEKGMTDTGQRQFLPWGTTTIMPAIDLSPMIESPEKGDEENWCISPDKKQDKEKKLSSSVIESGDLMKAQKTKHIREIEMSMAMAGESSLERESDDIFSSAEDQPTESDTNAPPSTPRTGEIQKDPNFFAKTAPLNEVTIKNLEIALDNQSQLAIGKLDRPRSNIRIIQNELPQRTFTSNVNKRKKIGCQEDTRKSQIELNKISLNYSPKPSKPKSGEIAKSNDSSSTLFPFPPKSTSPKSTFQPTSPNLKKNVSNSLKKLADISSPIKLIAGSEKEKTEEMTAGKREEDVLKMKQAGSEPNDSKTELSPLTQSNLEKHEKNFSKELQSRFDNLFNMDSPTTLKSSPTAEGDNYRGYKSKSKFEFPSVTSPTEINDAFSTGVSGDRDDRDSDGRGDHCESVDDAQAPTDDHSQSKPSNKRKKRNDRKSISGDASIRPAETEGKPGSGNNRKSSKDVYQESMSSADNRQNRKYSILTTDGSIKNFVSENSEEFKRTNESLNKENTNKKKTGNRRGSECPQRHRRVSIIQGDSLRHFIFEEPDTSKMKPNKQRRVDTTRNILLEDNVYKRKSSLIPGDTLKNLLGDDGSRKPFIGPDDKPRKFSINTLGDIVSARKFSLLPPGEIYTSQIDGKTTEIIKLAPGTKGRPLATIVVQQASIQRGSISGPSGQKEDSLLDVANTFTLEELHEFDMKYGSPHHSRSQSVKTPGRSCGRPNYLCLPQQRSRVASMPNTGVEEEYYRLRHFSITGKGVVNRGDSLKSRRSRSNNSVASSNSSHSTEQLPSNMGTIGSYPGSARTSAECSLASSRESSTSSIPYKVVMLGSAGVGKSSLISQFMTSEYLHAYDTSLDEEFGEKSVSVLLDDEESELIFVDHPSAEMSPENCITTYQPQAYIIVYSVVDRLSFQIAEETLQSLWKTDSIGSKAVILVGNKTDLVRSRTISSEEGKNMATSYDCKFIETSVGINHNVDELLVGILTQIRLKLQQGAKPKRNKSPLGRCIGKNGDSPKKWRKSQLTASLKVKGLLGRVWARDSRSKSCENLHVL